MSLNSNTPYHTSVTFINLRREGERVGGIRQIQKEREGGREGREREGEREEEREGGRKRGGISLLIQL